jgi:hypothetical protein
MTSESSLSAASQSSVTRDIRLYGENYFKGGLIDYEISSLSYQPSQPGVSDRNIKQVPH